MSRTLSHTEISKALDCEAAWDFSYGGYLAGEALRPKAVAPNLSGGKAWGAAVAAYHGAHDTLVGYALAAATSAMSESLHKDAEKMAAWGLHDPTATEAMSDHLTRCLAHYSDLALAAQDEGLAPGWNVVPIPLQQLEGRLEVPIPSRTGKRASTRYRFLSYVDGITVDSLGDVWIVEFKLRGKLTSVEMIERSRQLRWYSWSYSVASKQEVRGVITEERLNEAPKPPRLVQARKKGEGIYDAATENYLTPSHAKDQLTTPEWYIAVCSEYGVDPDEETVTSLRARRWQQRVPVEFRAGELEEAGHELVSAAQKIAELDLGRRYPLRNVKPQTCNGCRFKNICPTPMDTLLVDVEFERKLPKRLLDQPEQELPEPALPQEEQLVF